MQHSVLPSEHSHSMLQHCCEFYSDCNSAMDNAADADRAVNCNDCNIWDMNPAP